MPLYNVTRGSKERFVVDIIDRSDTVTDLSSSVPKFDVLDSNDTYKYGNGTYAGAQASTASGMQITSIVDTNNGGTWDVGDYRFFVWFVVGSETIRKGPFEFALVE